VAVARPVSSTTSPAAEVPSASTHDGTSKGGSSGDPGGTLAGSVGAPPDDDDGDDEHATASTPTAKR
jgi:hypothetical protein